MHPRTIELRSYLDRQRRVLEAAFEAVPVIDRDVKPTQESWSAAGVIEHLALVNARIARRLLSGITKARDAGLAAESDDSPLLPTFDMTPVIVRDTPLVAAGSVEPTGIDAEAAWAALRQSDERLREALTAGDGLALDTVKLPHPRFGTVSFYWWFAFIGAHEERHANQIREIAAAVLVNRELPAEAGSHLSQSRKL